MLHAALLRLVLNHALVYRCNQRMIKILYKKGEK
jgi:hypothetical protein